MNINWKFLRNVLLKTAGLTVILCMLPAFTGFPDLGKMSAYNLLFPGRERFPFGENQQESYNLSLYNLDAMFASLRLTGSVKPANEYRVIMIGDSSVWGSLLRPEETLAGVLDRDGLTTCDAKRIRFYNLGYPTLSLTKDLMILQEALKYQPDLIVWPFTLESFPKSSQFSSPLLANNPERVQKLVDETGLALTLNDSNPVKPNWWDRTLIGRRRELADLFRLQAYGVMWAATGLDQAYPVGFQHAQRDFEANDTSFHEMKSGELDVKNLALDVLASGVKISSDVPVVMVNEPILISSGKNSDVRYNFYYPRWAYDQYRNIIANSSQQAGWTYMDLWNITPEEHFTNSAIHMDAPATKLFAEKIKDSLRAKICIR
jgi:hypothetical protein